MFRIVNDIVYFSDFALSIEDFSKIEPKLDLKRIENYREIYYSSNQSFVVEANPIRQTFIPHDILKLIEIWISNIEEIKLAYITLKKPSIEQTRNNKIAELKKYHYFNNEVRLLRINNTTYFSMAQNMRDLILEQIADLENQQTLLEKGELKDITTTFKYIDSNTWNSTHLDVIQLRKIWNAMMKIVKSNYMIYSAHEKNLKNLQRKESETEDAFITRIKNYNFKKGYITNQNIDV